MIEEGKIECNVCRSRFGRQWASRGVCWRCEGRLRAAGRCPFDRRAWAEAGAQGEAGARGEAGVDKPARESVAGDSEALQSAAEGEVAAAPAADKVGSHDGQSKAAKASSSGHAFCPHQSRCAECDASFRDCITCRISKARNSIWQYLAVFGSVWQYLAVGSSR